MRIRLTDLGDPQVKEFQKQGPLEKGLSFKQKGTRNSFKTHLQGKVPLLETHRSLLEEAVETDFKSDQTTKKL